MSDLINRLRNHPEFNQRDRLLLDEAADEIEKLRAEPQRKPPSDAFVYKVVRSVQPNPADTCNAWADQFYECKYWLDAAHGITGEPT